MRDDINLIGDSDWECPECHEHDVILFVHPHRYAGIFECQVYGCGASWSCEHDEHETDEVEDPPMNPEQTAVYHSTVATCILCGVDCTEQLA